MELFFYNIFLLVFKAGVRIAGLFDGKAKKWVTGRKNIFEKLETAITANNKIIWIHCASLGEFEQGRPLLEELRSRYKDYKLLLTFFSPSGYEIRKDYKGADWVYYMPMDGVQNAKRFLNIVNPSLVIFVKYEFWYYYLKGVKQRNIPLLLVSALFREDSGYFKWYSGLQRKMLFFFQHLFVQTEASKKMLASIGINHNCSVSGDTRFDRVIEIAENSAAIPVIEQFIANRKTIVAGSTWPEDEDILQKTMQAISDPLLQLIIAPHEINKEHIAQLQRLFPEAVLYSQLLQRSERTPLESPFGQHLNPEHPNSNILIIDNIGMLSRLYKYAYITYIGGGFGKGIHNTLEAAVYGKPVLFGTNYHKFNEAMDLINTGGAISINNAEDGITTIKKLLQDEKLYLSSSESARKYVYANKGATEKIMKFIQENRLLTN
ncbi:MAG: glycosyltransferase N-terminal domain-containing protein [Chitinophagaceae bacterium]